MKNEYIEGLIPGLEDNTTLNRGEVLLIRLYQYSKSEDFDVLVSGPINYIRAEVAGEFVDALRASGIGELYFTSEFSNQLENWMAMAEAGLKLCGMKRIINPRFVREMSRYGSTDESEYIPAMLFCLDYSTSPTEIESLEALSDTITAIANRAVKHGTENTSSGNYIMGYDVFADLITEDDFRRYFDLIAVELEKREEVLDLVVDHGAYELDCNFGLAYCPNYEWCEGDESTFGCSYEEWEQTPARPVSQPLSMRRMAEIGKEAISSTKEWFDHPEEELEGSFGMTEEEMRVFGVEKEEK